MTSRSLLSLVVLAATSLAAGCIDAPTQTTAPERGWHADVAAATASDIAPTYIPIPNGTHGTATVVNGAGNVYGFFWTTTPSAAHVFRWSQADGFTDLGTFGYEWAQPRAVLDDGTLLVNVNGAGGRSQGLVVLPSGATQLVAPEIVAQGGNFLASGINDNLGVVGAYVAAQPHGSVPGYWSAEAGVISVTDSADGYINAGLLGITDDGRAIGNPNILGEGLSGPFCWSIGTGVAAPCGPTFPDMLLQVTTLNLRGLAAGEVIDTAPAAAKPYRAVVWPLGGAARLLESGFRAEDWVSSVDAAGDAVGATQNVTWNQATGMFWPQIGGVETLGAGQHHYSMARGIDPAGTIAVGFVADTLAGSLNLGWALPVVWILPPPSPQALIVGLRQAVTSSAAAGALTAGQATALLASVDAAAAANQRGNIAATRGIVNALRHKLVALTRSGRITPQTAASLIGIIDRLETALGNGGG